MIFSKIHYNSVLVSFPMVAKIPDIYNLQEEEGFKKKKK